jgi:protein tyrosine/serine phosphatase
MININRFLTSTLLVCISTVTIFQPAQAGSFDFLNDINNAAKDVNDTVNSVKGTQQNTSNTLGNLTNFLGIGQVDNSNSGDPTDRLLDIYSKWYISVSPEDKETINLLTTKYAEDTPITFADFTKSPTYQAKDTRGKSQSSALFFKFNEVVKTVGPQKDKFLAYAFCVNGGGKNCK